MESFAELSNESKLLVPCSFGTQSFQKWSPGSTSQVRTRTLQLKRSRSQQGNRGRRYGSQGQLHDKSWSRMPQRLLHKLEAEKPQAFRCCHPWHDEEMMTALSSDNQFG
eukprot:6492355-Amphidinium_carterae.2